MPNKIIEVSLLAFYKKNLKEELDELKKIGIKRIHYDVMDNVYVPNYTFKDEYIEILKSYDFEIEIHLMVAKPLQYFNIFKKYRPDAIVFHPSPANKNEILKIMDLAKINNINVGLAININEDFNNYKDIFRYTQINLIMGVKAGFGGQKITQIGINHLNDFRNYLSKNKLNIPIIFDGGVNDKTIKYIYKNANYIVSGSYLINSVDKKAAYDKLLLDNK